MAKIISRRTVRIGTKTQVFVIEKFMDGYGVGRYRYGGLTIGWEHEPYLADARKVLDRMVRKARGGKR